MAKKFNRTGSGKGGYTLVELSVVLALIAILGTMIVSFSVLMHGFAAENEAEYKFMEDTDTLQKLLDDWIAENDLPNAVFFIADDGSLTVSENGEEKSADFEDGVLSLGDTQRPGLDAIDGVVFSSNGKLIKCLTFRLGKNGKISESSFVVSLRSGTVVDEVENE